MVIAVSLNLCLWWWCPVQHFIESALSWMKNDGQMVQPKLSHLFAVIVGQGAETSLSTYTFWLMKQAIVHLPHSNLIQIPGKKIHYPTLLVKILFWKHEVLILISLFSSLVRSLYCQITQPLTAAIFTHAFMSSHLKYYCPLPMAFSILCVPDFNLCRKMSPAFSRRWRERTALVGFT